ncbi:unnamed protein product, partial [Sphacelaria rigidula]
PEQQCGFRRQRSTTDMMLVVRRLQELGRPSNVPIGVCFIDLQKVYDSVDRTLQWEVLARFGVPSRMIAIIRMFHDSMRARVQLESGEISAWFHVCQGLRQGCVSFPLLFNIFGADLEEVSVQRFAADPVIVSGLVFLDDAPKDDGGEPVEETPLEKVRRGVWAMLYADDAGKASRTSEGLARMVAAALGIEAAGQRYKQTGKFIYLGEAIIADAKMSIESNRRISAAQARIRKYSSQLYDRPNAELSLKVRRLKEEVVEALLYGCATWTLRSEDFDSLGIAHHNLLLRVVVFRREDQ